MTWQWRDPAWVHDLVYDTAWRIGSDDVEDVFTIRIPPEVTHIVETTFPCFTNYQVAWFIENVYRHMGRYCIDVPKEIVRDTTNYMREAPTLTDTMNERIQNNITMGVPSMCISAAIRRAYLQNCSETVRISFPSGGLDEQAFAEYEETANSTMISILNTFKLHLAFMKYTTAWSAKGHCSYKLCMQIESHLNNV